MATTSTALVPVSSAAEKAAVGTVISNTSLWTSITGIFSGGIIGTAATIFAIIAPTQVATIIAILIALGGLIGAVANVLGLLHLNTATTEATLSKIEQLLNTGVTGLGGKPQDFDRDGTVETSST